MKNWRTTVMSVIGAVWIILRIVNPDFFTEDLGQTILTAVDVVIGAVLTVIAALSAKDEIKIDNL